MMIMVVVALQGYRKGNEEGNNKKDTALTMAMNQFKGGLGKVSSKTSALLTSLTTIAFSLAAFTNPYMTSK